ncbi:ATP-binding protein [Sphingomonas sp. NFR15]|uniref:ATP-binding protein n=1 Tax=Sphingomonas sp. NFR15 TaxID=1566282 RepID=UPI00088DAFEB|nr:ATP-binding protein [Sphingomonas sp. NFR15]SDA13634.1 two-component system, OmpR family, phosphate regulon sensor histidine kinase PhoR [Sphingomonas sp. NFR15]
MMNGFGLRTLAAVGIIVVASVAVFLIGDLQASLVTLIGGIAAVLTAAGVGDGEDDAAPAPAAEPAAPPDHIPAVIDAIVEPILIVTSGQVSHANEAARALLGQHIVGQDVRLAIRHPGAAERLMSPLGQGAQPPINLVGLGAREQRWEMRIGDAAGGRRIVHLVDQTGSYAAERMRVDFVANASHELRTPLASILGYIETLGDEAGEEKELRERFLKIMFDEARRMQRLIEDLISLSRIEAEKYRLPDRAVDLGALIEEVRGGILDAQGENAAPIIADLAADVPPVSGDSAQLSQVLHNLIGNAIKYGRKGAPVTIRLERLPTGMVRFAVSDEGDGIPAEHIPRLTERFYRVDTGRSRAAGGTGLGLSIVKHIVERHRGRLDIESSIGKGTTVSVMIPAHGRAVIKR